MERSTQVAHLLEVYERELDEIVRRRREAGLSIEGNDGEARRLVAEELVGLALSGGGVRSAAFNLGLIQALYKAGTLKEIDYLSTVSGGGYVGACLSSIALKPETRFDWQEPEANHGKESSAEETQPEATPPSVPSERGFELAVLPDGRQPKRVNELIHSGTSLRRPLLFLNRYLIGVVLTNIVVLSGLFAVCALAAILFRSTDYLFVMNWLYALGFRGDVMRAFFPATMFFAMWLLSWATSYWRSGVKATGRVARIFLALTIVSILMAVAMLIGTGDVSLTYVRDNWGIEPPQESVEALGRDLKNLFFIALVIALLPYLRVKDLIRSGTRPRNVFEGWIFAIATRGLLYGLPLLVFGCFARENISGFNEQRMGERHGVSISFRSDLQPLDFEDWRGTWRELELESSVSKSPSDTNDAEPQNDQDSANATKDEDTAGLKGRYAVGQRMWKIAGDENARESIQLVDDMAGFDSQYGPVRRWLLFVGQLVTGESNKITEQYERRKRHYDLRAEICQDLTDKLLCSSTAYQLFEKAENDFPAIDTGESDKLARRLGDLIEQGKLLEARIEFLEDKYPVRFAQWLSDDPLPVGWEQFDMEAREQYARTEEELKDNNWQLLQAYFGSQLKPKTTVFAYTVLAHDQMTRLTWFVGSLAVFVVSGLLVNLNATSLHGFYRNSISNVWIDPVPGFGESIPLTSLDTTSRGAPYHLINATVHLMGLRLDMDQPTTDNFLFSQCYCGSKRTGFQPTDEYAGGRYNLPNAVAVSGAAVTPSQVQNPLLAVLLFLSNSRLGQWLPNPAYKMGFSDKVRSRLRLPFSPIRLMIGLFQPAELRNHCFVADGGHHENLGLEALLERRVRTIIVSDVTCDPQYQFEDLVRLHRRIAAQLGIRIEGLSEPDHLLDLSPLFPDEKTRRSRSHVICARIHYPRLESLGEYGSPLTGLLIYLKPGLTGDESLDLRSHHEHSLTFPHDTTADQFYDPDRFESYRQLGYHMGLDVARVYRSRGHAAQTSSGDADENAPLDPPQSPIVQELQKDLENPGADLSFLVARLHHEDPEHQLLAIHAIGELLPGLGPAEKQKAVNALTNVLLQSPGHKPTLEKTVWALGESGDALKLVSGQLLDFVEMHHGDVRIRTSVLELLKDWIPQDPHLRSRLETVAKTSSPMIRNKAAMLLDGGTPEKHGSG